MSTRDPYKEVILIMDDLNNFLGKNQASFYPGGLACMAIT